MNQRERTIAIVAGAAIGIYAAFTVVVDPLLAQADEANTAAADARVELAEIDQKLESAERLQRRWTQLGGRNVSSDAQEAEGQLLTLVPQWADDAKLTLTSLKPERTGVRDGFGVVTVRANATGNLRAVAEFLHAAERADVPVRATEVGLTAAKEGTDELTVTFAFTTIHTLPPTSASGAR